MIVFYTARPDGTLVNLSLNRTYDEAAHVDITRRDFVIAQHSLSKCKIVDGQLVISEQAREEAGVVLKQYYKKRLVKVIREQWSIDDEFNLINMRDENPVEYQEYRTKIHELKMQIKREIYGE